MTVTENGRHAITHYRAERRFEMPVACSLVQCRLETGRTHQIRVHLRAINHPVVGDRDYDGGRPGLIRVARSCMQRTCCSGTR